MVVQVQRVPLSERAAQLLLSRISSGEWPLGGQLPSEAVLATQLGVGRSTLREAVRRLGALGVLESRHGSGVFVAALDVPEDRDAVLRRADITSVLEARIAVEAEASALAAERRTAAELRAIRRAYAARIEPKQSPEEYADADAALHRSIVAASHNPVLLDLFDAFLPRVRHVMVTLMRVGEDPSSPEDHASHAAVVEAIAQRRAGEAALASRTHLEAVKERLT